MGACSDLWLDEVEKIGEDYAFDRITRDEAMKRLCGKGFDADEAATMLDEAIA